MTERWMRVARSEQLPLCEGRVVTMAEREIALFHLGDRVLATDNSCPHEGGPLCDGIVIGDSVVCPLHALKIDLATGSVERPPRAQQCVRTYPTRVEDGVVLVQLESSSADSTSSVRRLPPS
jgi:nitrite reductase (NADH) small subunit